MPEGLDNLKHIVVLMMENRSFDHMLGYLKAQDPRIDGVDGTQTNPDPNGTQAPVQPLAAPQGQLDPDPGHHFEDVDIQLFYGSQTNPRQVTMGGFVQAYYQVKLKNVEKARQLMYCFSPDKLPVLATLARKYAVFNAWFSSLPGPTIPNRVFAHFGTSFGKVDNSLFYINAKYHTIYERMVDAGRTAKIYHFDDSSSTIALAFLLLKQPKLFGTFDDFLHDCKSGKLPDYSFVEPNYKDHEVEDGMAEESDQHPDGNVHVGEGFIKAVYQAIRSNQQLWESSALLIVYDEHGGIYDHVPPPACTPDEFPPDPVFGFKFDRLGVRVPAVLVSPWIPEGTVVLSDRVFDHASIPASVTKKFIGAFDNRSPREKSADTFLDLLSLGAPRKEPDVLQGVSNPHAAAFFPDAAARLAGAAAARNVPGTLVGDIQAVADIHAAAPAVARSQHFRPLPMDSLLRDNVIHFHAAEMHLPFAQQTHIDLSSIKTEADALGYVRTVTQKLRSQGAE